VHPVLLVSDADIREAQRRLWGAVRIVAEPGGAAALAALVSKRYVPREGERIAVMVSGGNTTVVDFDR
jgi:threonine dehydratase